MNTRRPKPTAWVLLIIGLGLLLGSVWLTATQSGLTHPEATATAESAEATIVAQSDRPRALFAWLLAAIVIAVVYIIATVFIVRLGQRVRALLSHRRHPPTPAPDVWRMYRLPDE